MAAGVGNNNSGIMHLAVRDGERPVCGNRRAYQSGAFERFSKTTLRRCERCEITFAKWSKKREAEAA